MKTYIVWLREECHHEYPQQCHEPGGLDRRRHEADGRRWRAGVDIRRPHVEGHGGDLESDANQDEHHGQKYRLPTSPLKPPDQRCKWNP